MLNWPSYYSTRFCGSILWMSLMLVRTCDMEMIISWFRTHNKHNFPPPAAFCFVLFVCLFVEVSWRVPVRGSSEFLTGTCTQHPLPDSNACFQSPSYVSVTLGIQSPRIPSNNNVGFCLLLLLPSRVLEIGFFPNFVRYVDLWSFTKGTSQIWLEVNQQSKIIFRILLCSGHQQKLIV